MLLTDARVVFFGGKGGVGKTTCSAAFALGASRAGRRVLLVSTDPAHSTADIFERPIGRSEREILPRLWALEIDADYESARYVESVKQDIARMFSPGVVRQASRQIDLAAASPGLSEVALLDRIVDIIVEREREFDLVVFDTAPTGHTLQLLRMPEAMSAWVDALVKHRRALIEIDRGRGESEAAPDTDPVVSALERRRERLAALRRSVTDHRRTTFVLVTIAERLAIEETARAAELLSATDVRIGALVVNRLLPDGLAGDFYAARKAQEREYTAEIERRFARVTRIPIVQLLRDVHGLDAIGLISEQLGS